MFSTTDDEARWATLAQLRHPEQGLGASQGVVWGRYRGQVLRSDEGHGLVVAGTGSGKTASIVLPTLLEPQPGTSLLVHDPKGTLSPQTAVYRGLPPPWGAGNRVVVLNPCDPQSQQYNPLEGLTDMRDLQVFSEMLVNPDGRQVTDETSRHFMDCAAYFCTGFLTCGLQTGHARTLGAHTRWLMTADTPDHWRDLLRTIWEHDDPACKWASMVVGAMADRELGSLRTTVSRAFGVFLDPVVDRMTSRSDFSLNDLRNGVKPMTLYLSVPFTDHDRLRPLMRGLLRQWLGHAASKVHGWRYRLKVILEELPSFRYFPLLTEGHNYMREYGIQLLNITPSMNELAHWFSDKHNFQESTAVQLYFGLGDDRVAARVTKRIGTHLVSRVRRSSSASGSSTTYDQEEKPLINETALQQLSPRKIVLVRRGYKALVTQTRFYEESPWAERSAMVCVG